MRFTKLLTVALAMLLVGAVTAPPELLGSGYDAATTGQVASTLQSMDLGIQSPISGTQSSVSVDAETGEGFWGCAACLAAAGIVISGGYTAVMAFINFPGASTIVSACGIACFA